MYRNEVVLLDRGDYTTCAVNLCGAMVTSWRIRNVEHVFLSRRSVLHYRCRVMGGMSVAFPKYGVWEFGKQHGFARDLKWTVEIPPRRNDNGDVYAEFILENNEYTNALWAYKFKLRQRMTLREMELEMRFTVENTSQHFPMEFDFVQHCLFKVSDVAKCKVYGVEDCIAMDGSQQADAKGESHGIGVQEKTDRTYKDAPDVIYVTNGEDEEVIKITKANLPDFNLWNPWIDMARDLEDLGDDEYKYFVSTNCGAIAKQISLGPKCNWTSKITYEIQEPKEKQVVVGHFYDYFNKYC